MFRVDTMELRTFAKQVGGLDKQAAKGFRSGIRKAGELVAAEAKARAAFSSRIPASIKVRPHTWYVVVEAGGEAAPDAAPLENRGREGHFRHPVNAWARKDRAEYKWGEQKAHPFLRPAFEAAHDAAIEAITSSVDKEIMGVIG